MIFALAGSLDWTVYCMILSRVGCDKSKIVILVLVGYGTRSEGIGHPFADKSWLTLRVLGPGRN